MSFFRPTQPAWSQCGWTGFDFIYLFALHPGCNPPSLSSSHISPPFPLPVSSEKGETTPPHWVTFLQILSPYRTRNILSHWLDLPGFSPLVQKEPSAQYPHPNWPFYLFFKSSIHIQSVLIIHIPCSPPLTLLWSLVHLPHNFMAF